MYSSNFQFTLSPKKASFHNDFLKDVFLKKGSQGKLMWSQNNSLAFSPFFYFGSVCRNEGLGFLNGSAGESTCNPGDTGDACSIPGSRRSPGEGNGNPLQYSCLKNCVDRGTWKATVQRVVKNWT